MVVAKSAEENPYKKRLNPYGILSPEELAIEIRTALKNNQQLNKSSEVKGNLATRSLSEVFEGATEMFRQIEAIKELKMKRKNQLTFVEKIGTSKAAIFSLFVMAAVFGDANMIYNQIARMNRKTETDNPIRKSIGDSFYVWLVQITALPVKAVFSVAMFIDCLMILPLISLPVAIQALRGKFNGTDSPNLSELFHVAIGYIIKPFTYDILNPYMLIKDYVPIISWALGSRKLFSGYTQINTTIASKKQSEQTSATATSTNASENSNSIKPTSSTASRLKSLAQSVQSKFTLPKLTLPNRQSSATNNIPAPAPNININDTETNPLKAYLKTIGNVSSDTALNQAIHTYIQNEPNALCELKREIALHYLVPKSSHTKNLELLNKISDKSNEPLLEILAYSSRSKILMEIFQDHQLKNKIIDYLSKPDAYTLQQLQVEINRSYQNNMLSTSSHFLPAHKNELQKIYDQLAQATGVELLHDKHQLLSSTPDIKFSHAASKPISTFDYDGLINVLKQEYAKNPEITKFEAGKFKYKGNIILRDNIYVFNIDGVPNFIKQGKELGEGNSAKVYKAVNITHQHERLVLKIFKEKEEMDSIQKEASSFSHYYQDEGKKAYPNKDAILMPFFDGNIEINDNRLIAPNKKASKNNAKIKNKPASSKTDAKENLESGSRITIKGARDEEMDKKFADQLGNQTDSYFDKYKEINKLKNLNEFKMSHSPRLTADQAVKDYVAQYSTLNDNKKSDKFLEELRSLIASYRTTPLPSIDDERIDVSKKTDNQKITSNLDIEQINFLIECSKAACIAIDKFNTVDQVPLDFKLDNLKLNRDPETNKIKASPIDFGSIAELEKGQATIVDSATLLHGTIDYATPYNRNVYESILNNLDIYLVSTKVQAMKQMFDKEDSAFQAYITNNLPPEDQKKLDDILTNPIKLDNYVYSSKTAAYSLGHALEKHIGRTLGLKPIDDYDNISNKYEYSNDIKGNKDYKALDLLNNLLGIINDLKDDALSRATAADAIEKLNALTQRPKIHI